jgi:hypothetical protein
MSARWLIPLKLVSGRYALAERPAFGLFWFAISVCARVGDTDPLFEAVADAGGSALYM